MCFAVGFQRNRSRQLKNLILDLIEVREAGHPLNVDLGVLHAAAEMKTLYSPSALMKLIMQAEQDAVKSSRPARRLVKIHYHTTASGLIYQNNVFWESFAIMPVYEGNADDEGEMCLLLYGPDYAIREWLRVCFNGEYEHAPDDVVTESESNLYDHYIQTTPFSSTNILAKIDMDTRCLMTSLRLNWPGLWDGEQDVSGSDLIEFLSEYVQKNELKRFQFNSTGDVELSRDRRVHV